MPQPSNGLGEFCGITDCLCCRFLGPLSLLPGTSGHGIATIGVLAAASLTTTTSATSVSAVPPSVQTQCSADPVADSRLPTAIPVLASLSRDAALFFVKPVPLVTVHVTPLPQSPIIDKASWLLAAVAAVVPESALAVVLLFAVPAADTSRQPVPADPSRPEYSSAVHPSWPVADDTVICNDPVELATAVPRSTNTVADEPPLTSFVYALPWPSVTATLLLEITAFV